MSMALQPDAHPEEAGHAKPHDQGVLQRDAVFGEIKEDGPNYRNVCQGLLGYG